MQFVMHMTSASIDQVSGRIEEKLALLGEDGLMLSDETVQKIKDALSGIPGASSSVAHVLNGLGKDKRLDDLDGFFKLDLPGDNKSASSDGAEDEAKVEDRTESYDSQLLGKDARKKFAKYLDETLPKTKYFNQFFQRAFDNICDFINSSLLRADSIPVFGAVDNGQDESVLSDIVVRLAQQAELLMQLSSFQNVTTTVDNAMNVTTTADNAIAAFNKAALRVKAAAASFELAVAIAVVVAGVVFNLASAVVLVAVMAISFAIASIRENVIKIFNAVKQAIDLVFKMVVQAIKLVFTVIITVVKAIIYLIVGVVAAVAIALGLVVVLGLAVVLAAFLIAVAVVLAVAVALAILAAALIVVAAVFALAILVSAVVLLAAGVVLTVAILTAMIVLTIAIAAASILLAALAVAVVFVLMATSIVIVSAAIVVLAAAILVIGLALATGIMLVGTALALGAMMLGMAVIYGVGAILAFAFASVIAIMGMSVIAMGAFLATAYAFTGMLVVGLIGLITGVVVSLLALFLLGMLLIGQSAKEIWDYLEPYWEKIKGWWEEIKAWWGDSFIKKMLDKVDEVGGWGNFFAWLWDTAKQKIVDWFKSTKIGQWIDSAIDWWDNFSFTGILKKFWENFKSWILKKWNGFCDWLAGINIPYPNGISYQGPDHWYSKINPLNYKISWGYWYLFKDATSWKSDVANDQVGDIPPPDEPDSQDDKIAEEMQQAVDDGLTEQDREQISLAKNIFEQDRLRKEAIRRRREQLRNNPIVVPQTITYQNQPLYGGGGSAGLYSGVLGSGYGG